MSTLTLGPAAAAAEPSGAAAAAQSPDRFGRLFPTVEPFAQPTPAVQAALTELGRLGGIMDAKDALDRGPVALITDPSLGVNNRDNPNQTAAVTFMGQFFDHDMTFETTSRLGVATDPQASPNARTPSFDLDSVHGRGPVADPVFYSTADRHRQRRPPDRAAPAQPPAPPHLVPASGQRCGEFMGLAPILRAADLPELRALGVFLGLLQADPASYLSVQPTWRPTLPSQTPGDFRMTDFLRFAQVDPASRGQ